MNLKEKKTLKLKIIETCKKLQTDTITNLKRELDEHQQLANEYGPPRDRYDPFRAQMLRRRDIFAKQLQIAHEEMFTLDKIKPEEVKTKIEFGAVVITNLQNLFVATGLGKITVDNKLYFCISPGVPVYKALEGLKPGDTTTLNDNTYRIDDVF